ncbi:unnamed protein product [Soboliphyme baturini]|uniref:CUB domain-containing protein n=1 Tax=Soboliphyme baturini TaxID=241478 RepID=A0A183IBI3_9BILA|nr:unnamed protein product [Soboliphyme baturini]
MADLVAAKDEFTKESVELTPPGGGQSSTLQCISELDEQPIFTQFSFHGSGSRGSRLSFQYLEENYTRP